MVNNDLTLVDEIIIYLFDHDILPSDRLEPYYLYDDLQEIVDFYAKKDK